MSGPKAIGDLLGGEIPAAKDARSTHSLVAKIQATQQAYREKVMQSARPGETFDQVEARLREENTPRRAPTQANPNTSGQTMRHPPQGDAQPDFFVPGLYDVATKDNRVLMDVALFRLSKRDKRAGEVIRYDLPDGYVEVKAGPDGMASIWDYDIVLMLISHLTDAVNQHKAGRGPLPGKKFVPHVSDIAKFCRRGDGGRQVDEIEAALDRLIGTTVKSVREQPARKGARVVRKTETESLIGPYSVVARTDSGKVSRIEIGVPDWIYKEVTSGQKPDVLTMHQDYFLIEPGLGRFVYRLARRAGGKSRAKWSFKTIYERSGSTGTFKEFSRILRKLIAANGLPQYSLTEVEGVSGPQLVMTHRDTESLPAEDADDQGENGSGV